MRITLKATLRLNVLLLRDVVMPEGWNWAAETAPGVIPRVYRSRYKKLPKYITRVIKEAEEKRCSVIVVKWSLTDRDKISKLIKAAYESERIDWVSIVAGDDVVTINTHIK